MVVVGERRWAAAGRAGLEQVPVILLDQDLPPSDLLMIQIEENEGENRQDLTLYDLARAVALAFEQSGLSQNHFALRHRKSRSWLRPLLLVAQAGGLLGEALREGHIRGRLVALTFGRLSADHQRELLAHARRHGGPISLTAAEKLANRAERKPRTVHPTPEAIAEPPADVVLPAEITVAKPYRSAAAEPPGAPPSSVAAAAPVPAPPAPVAAVLRYRPAAEHSAAAAAGSPATTSTLSAASPAATAATAAAPSAASSRPGAGPITAAGPLRDTRSHIEAGSSASLAPSPSPGATATRPEADSPNTPHPTPGSPTPPRPVPSSPAASASPTPGSFRPDAAPHLAPRSAAAGLLATFAPAAGPPPGGPAATAQPARGGPAVALPLTAIPPADTTSAPRTTGLPPLADGIHITLQVTFQQLQKLVRIVGLEPAATPQALVHQLVTAL
jgi:ParB-like chromosome segregation protein Spo0J